MRRIPAARATWATTSARLGRWLSRPKRRFRSTLVGGQSAWLWNAMARARAAEGGWSQRSTPMGLWDPLGVRWRQRPAIVLEAQTRQGFAWLT